MMIKIMNSACRNNVRIGMVRLAVLMLCLFTIIPAFATDKSEDVLLSMAGLNTETATQQKITELLGTPGKKDESKKYTYWYYTRGNSEFTISWDNRSSTVDKISFQADDAVVPGSFDTRLSTRLRSGVTSMNDALKLLGTPNEMLVKSTKQELHYTFSNSRLRLFFRDHTLVDFCLY